MKTFLLKHINSAISVLVTLFVALFWYFLHPEAMSYQEQYQLWLWDTDYFYDSVSQMGGLADFIGEFIVQWYKIEWLGALLLGGVYGLICWLVSRLARSVNEADSLFPVFFGGCVSMLLLWLMSDESILMSYPVALILAMSLFLVLKKANVLYDIIVIPAMYWLIGPVVWVYAIMKCIYRYEFKTLWLPVYVIASQILIFHFFMPQWPLQSALCGIGYYRMPLDYSLLQILIPVIICVGLWIYRLLRDRFSKSLGICTAIIVVILAYFANNSYNVPMYELMRQDYLIRNERWNEVIERAEKVTIPINFWSESVNLSLGMTGQLADRQFDFFQSGQDALIMPMVRDITSNMPSMEAFYRLGMINECLRYAFDMQECIPNGKKSGRLSQRIVECSIINGKYSIAQKYIGILKKSTFYREWAEEAEKYLYDDAKVESHALWGKARQMRYKVNILFYYPQIEKMFANLFATNTSNRLALEYCIAQDLLKGNADDFRDHLSWAQQYGGYQTMPRAYQDAYNCIMAQGNLPGSSYAEYAKRMYDMQSEGGFEQTETH